MDSIECANCGVTFDPPTNVHKYCSTECRELAENTRKQGSNLQSEATRNSKGAAMELLVCSDLLLKGYHVFRSQSPACPFDLAAYREGSFIRIEVKAGSLTTSGNLNHSKLKNNEYDVLAVVSPDLKIYYQPNVS